LLLLVAASMLSLKSFDAGVDPTKPWARGATTFLCLIFISSTIMSLVLTGIDPDQLTIGPLDNSLNNINDRNPNG
jgi:TRAP-type mannitol/chloroaromatic compound transport system permease large subunit